MPESRPERSPRRGEIVFQGRARVNEAKDPTRIKVTGLVRGSNQELELVILSSNTRVIEDCEISLTITKPSKPIQEAPFSKPVHKIPSNPENHFG